MIFCNIRLCFFLFLIRQVQIFHFLQFHRIYNTFMQFLSQFPLLLNQPYNFLFPFFQISVIRNFLNYIPNLLLIQIPRNFLPIPSNKRYSRPFIKKFYRIFHLRHFKVQFFCHTSYNIQCLSSIYSLIFLFKFTNIYFSIIYKK